MFSGRLLKRKTCLAHMILAVVDLPYGDDIPIQL
jgi:hypothetical protein